MKIDKNDDLLPALRHIDLVVSSLDKSLSFYRELLGLLGWKKEIAIKGERGERLVYIAGPLGFKDGALGFRERQATKRVVPYERYDLGLHHVAINAQNREVVDKVAAWLKSKKHSIESGPAEYYNVHYYAVFFYDRRHKTRSDLWLVGSAQFVQEGKVVQGAGFEPAKA